MPLPWPTFWQDVPEEDRGALSEILTRLLANGAILGDAGRERELYLLARDFEARIGEYFAPLQLEMVLDPDQPILQLRPVPGDCGLVARFNKAETLVLLTLWRIYHDVRMERASLRVIVTVNELWSRLKLYFEQIEPPNETQLREILNTFRVRRLLRIQRSTESEAFGDASVEILPTLHRIIPFEDEDAWAEQCELYRGAGEDDADAMAEEHEEEPEG